ncbi:MAG: hypothetical protein WA789_08905, partial [Candidatus Acidiferrum sp.]
MKREHVAVLLMLGLGAAGAARAQEAVPNTTVDNHNVAAPFSAAPATNVIQFHPTDAATGALSPAAGIGPEPGFASPMMPSTMPDASPAPAPAPTPTFLYGGRDDYRWQLAIGADWLRFRSSIFNASAVGIDSSVTYFTNEWLGIEGNIATGFAPQIFDREHVKLLIYGAGPKIAWRQHKWEPWVHAIVGGAHEQPQTAGNSRNAFAVEAGGGADYRINPRFSGRLEADWVHTSFFSQSQNNFKLMAGVVFH